MWHVGKPDAVASYILMTTEPNEVAAKVHDRMPVLLHARDVSRWLDPAVRNAEDVVGLLRPYAAGEIEARPVSKRVSDPRVEGPELIEIDNSVRELWD
jgi:putative SOS response-associated peptidase YedK